MAERVARRPIVNEYENECCLRQSTSIMKTPTGSKSGRNEARKLIKTSLLQKEHPRRATVGGNKHTHPRRATVGGNKHTHPRRARVGGKKHEHTHPRRARVGGRRNMNNHPYDQGRL